MEGALLRLRPKVMTVSTVVAGLLPIMWSTSVGAEVMKPLATPVLGGMISSLLHVLIVTPVLFFWIRERRLGLHGQPLPPSESHSHASRHRLLGAVIVLLFLAGAFAAWRLSRAAPSGGPSPEFGAHVVQTVRSKDVDITLLSPTGALRTGRNTFTIEFRSASGALLDMGTVSAAANMSMPGMVMSGNVQVNATDTPGRYMATAEFGMAGAWQMRIEWNGPAGRGSTGFEGTVQ
jgi:hypothetical protein